MADLDAAIRAELTEYDQGDSPAHLAAAIEAVLDIHTPDLNGDCGDCLMADQNRVGYPCPTVLAIARELGLSGGTQQAGTQ